METNSKIKDFIDELSIELPQNWEEFKKEVLNKKDKAKIDNKSSLSPLISVPFNSLINKEMSNWLIDYNTKIPHHSLFMKTPVQYLLENNPQCHMLWTNTIY